MEKYNEKPYEEMDIVCEYFETIWLNRQRERSLFLNVEP
jgi:hypothetical protein